MSQVRFTIGVPRAGSAARDAESAREHFRSLRPQAGSAARQAEEARRAEETLPARLPASATIRMRTPQRTAAELDPAFRLPVAVMDEPRASNQEPSPSVSMQAADKPEHPVVPLAAASTHPSVESNPLHTAAAKFRSLFRSVFPRAAGEI